MLGVVLSSLSASKPEFKEEEAVQSCSAGPYERGWDNGQASHLYSGQLGGVCACAFCTRCRHCHAPV